MIMFTDRSYTWHYRQLIKGKRSGRNIKGVSYINRCLDELDLENAIKKAEDLYFLISKNVDKDGE